MEEQLTATGLMVITQYLVRLRHLVEAEAEGEKITELPVVRVEAGV